MKIEDTSLLIIDVQSHLLPAMEQKEQVLANIEKLVTGAMRLGVPAMATEQYPKGLGSTVDEVSRCYRGNVATIAKTSFSAQKEQDVSDWVQGMARKNILICGMETHICVKQTVKELLELGFHPVVLTDCVASRKTEDKQVALASMASLGAEISTLEAALFELLGDAKHEAFKEISNLIK